MSTPAAYFDAMYRDADDPWHLSERWYEQRKHALTVAALPRARYSRAFEPACSAGALSVLLADRCDVLLSCDRSPRAVASIYAQRIRELNQMAAADQGGDDDYPDADR